jgi:uncharacterized protein YdhG (YjbR/CyaY superfamily)
MIEWEEAREVLSHIRAVLKDAVPEASEKISYGMPMYTHHGHIMGFAVFKKHCSLFPGHSVAEFEDELKGFKLSKGTIQFSPSSPPSDDLIRRIALHRRMENESTKAN